MERGEVWWANLQPPRGSEPGYSRPVVIIQANRYNVSNLHTVIVAVITGNIKLSSSPGNVFLAEGVAGLKKDSIVNVTQLLTLDRIFLTEFMGNIPPRLLAAVDAGLRLAMSLP